MFFDEPLVRTASIPLGLWICAAVVAHLAGGGGAMEAAQLVHERDELRALVRSARQGMHPADTTFEVLTDATDPTPAQKVEPPENAPKENAEGPPDPDAPKAEAEKAPKPPPEAPKPEAKVKEPPKPVDPPKPEAPKPQAPKPPPVPVAVPAKPAPPPPPAAPPPETDHRIAVKQNVQKDQKDNPNAHRIADDANHTDHETVARNRSHDQDLPNPSMGANKGPKGEIGSGDKEDKVAQSEEKKGNEDHAPGEKAKPTSTSATHENPAPPAPPTPNGKGLPPSVPGAKGTGGKGARPVAPEAPPPSPGGAGPTSPEVTAGEKGGYTLNPANPGGDGKSRVAGKKRQPEPFLKNPVHIDSMGLGGKGVPGGPQINLNMQGVEAAVGLEKLKQERASDGAARRSAHRGSWEKNKFDKWRAAIENYEPLVQLDNTTSLNAARVPFATYINSIHNRIHPVFAEEYLDSLNHLSNSHKLNADAKNVVTHLEVVLAKDTGRIVRMGVTRTSGYTEFDVAALKSVDRAQPFGKAPDLIVSPDGNVYLHWEFHRDPFDACTTRNARPFLLKSAPQAPVKPEGPSKRPGVKSPDEGSGTAPLIPLRRP